MRPPNSNIGAEGTSVSVDGLVCEKVAHIPQSRKVRMYLITPYAPVESDQLSLFPYITELNPIAPYCKSIRPFVLYHKVYPSRHNSM